MAKRATVQVMDHTLTEPWTQARFFDWAEKQPGRYEFDGFQPVAMTGGTADHDDITYNLRSAIDRRLGRGPCRTKGPNAGVQTVGTIVRYPDGLVTCSPYRGTAHVIPGVVIVSEVLSPSSAYIDGHVKVEEYAAVQTIRRYVILESTKIGLTVRHRASANAAWHTLPVQTAGTLQLPEIGIEIPISEIYEGVTFTQDDERSD